jgi:hypothetical protein
MMTCPGCKKEFEHIQVVEYDGLVMLRVGALVIRELRAVCLQCGRNIYFSVSDKLIIKIIKRSSQKDSSLSHV